MIIKFIKDDKASWDEFSDACTFVYNTAEHESTKFIPFEQMFGRKPVLPVKTEKNGSDIDAKEDDFDGRF